jgi:hypothetical protein
MESASRLLTRRALDTLKAIATGEYKPPEAEATAPEIPMSETVVTEAPSEDDKTGDEPIENAEDKTD